MVSRCVYVFGLVATLPLAACSADDGGPASGAESDLKATALSKEGESCGGGMAHPKECASGLTCVLPTAGAIGGSGTCRKDDVSQQGEPCGGGMAHPKQCASGLTCVLPTSGAIGGSGTCEKDDDKR